MKTPITSPKFQWDWLLMNMIDYGVVNYYQMNVCRSYTDFVLYKFGRGRGILLTEVHIIMRTSPACYRVMSFDQDQIMYRTCKTARDVCRYLIAEFIPEYVKPKSAKERRLELIERRKKLREELGDRVRLGYMSGEKEKTDFDLDDRKWKIIKDRYQRR